MSDSSDLVNVAELCALHSFMVELQTLSEEHDVWLAPYSGARMKHDGEDLPLELWLLKDGYHVEEPAR